MIFVHHSIATWFSVHFLCGLGEVFYFHIIDVGKHMFPVKIESSDEDMID